VFACEPEWAALTKELAQDKVSIYTATNAFQDPHHVQARPSLIAKMRRADLLVCSGAELEIGWLPLLLRQSSNDKVQTGQPGYFEAAMQVPRLEVPAQVDRSMGDVHAKGNPHVQLDPHRIATIAEKLNERLSQLDPDNKSFYQQRYNDFNARWQKAIKQWEAKAAPLKDVPVAVYHKGYVYLFSWLGIREIVALEPKPGLPPSAGYLAEVKQKITKQPVKMVLYSAYQSDQASRWLGQNAHIPVVKLPFTVGGSDKATDLFGLFDDTINRLLSGLKS
ncbi:MAG: zinc ABC transporter substrate-binding protein, partial [Thioalkalispiraceae bacterium]|jgi:zinc/manganese transport system substrate-binding protein